MGNFIFDRWFEGGEKQNTSANFNSILTEFNG